MLLWEEQPELMTATTVDGTAQFDTLARNYDGLLLNVKTLVTDTRGVETEYDLRHRP